MFKNVAIGFIFFFKKISGFFFSSENSKSNTTYSQYKHIQKIQNQTQTQKIQYQTQTQKIKNQPQHTHNTNTPRNFKIKLNMLENIRTQTHESPLIQQNQPKSNSNSI